MLELLRPVKSFLRMGIEEPVERCRRTECEDRPLFPADRLPDPRCLAIRNIRSWWSTGTFAGSSEIKIVYIVRSGQKKLYKRSHVAMPSMWLALFDGPGLATNSSNISWAFIYGLLYSRLINNNTEQFKTSNASCIASFAVWNKQKLLWFKRNENKCWTKEKTTLL